MKARNYRILLLAWTAVLLLPAYAGAAGSGCSFMNEKPSSVAVLHSSEGAIYADYFDVRYSAQDPLFAKQGGMQTILERHRPVFERARHFFETELGWKLPATRRELNRPQLSLVLIQAPSEFTATTRSLPAPHIVMNSSVLLSRDFGSILVHHLAHAAEVEFGSPGEYWFYEATAGWMEGQFSGGSLALRVAQRTRLARPEVPLTDPDPWLALGASRFLDQISRTNRDLIRQVWQQWTAAGGETALDVISRILVLNHQPGLESHFQNYSLLSTAAKFMEDDATNVVLQPYSSLLFSGLPDGPAGGAYVSFTPEGPGSYAIGVIFYSEGEESGSLTLKRDLRQPWSIVIPYSGMDRYKIVISNSSGKEIKGSVRKSFDPAIPAVVEYFRAGSSEGGVQLEWKTARENGVAFWNLYRLDQGQKIKLNQFPIPASIDSTQGVHYVYVDSTAGEYYSLEAVTGEGFPAPLRSAELPQ